MEWIWEYYSPPYGATISGRAARLITKGTLDEFLNTGDDSRSSDTPVWLVGMVTEGTIPLRPVPREFLVQPYPEPAGVVGAYYAITANDGDVFAIGPLFADSSDGSPTFSALLALTDEELVVVTPSPYPTSGPDPNLTRDPDEAS